jgi:nucleoside-diphosphate-sugar epimerase
VTYLITGSSGFLGSNFKTILGNKGLILTCPPRENIASELKNVSQLELLIHCAGKAHSTKVSLKEEKAFFDSNVELTKRLTSIISENAIRVNTFVFISTVAVYGIEEGNQIIPAARKPPTIAPADDPLTCDTLSKRNASLLLFK